MRIKRLPLFKKACQAFSLVEIALVLCIVGVASSYAIPTYLKARKVAKIHETDAKMESITYALAEYAVRNNLLPTPADLTLSDGESKAGLYNGIVPYVTLGLQESDAKDGFGRWFTYATASTAVTPAFATLDTTVNHDIDRPFCFTHDKNARAKITVQSIDGTSKANLTNDFVAFVLISHGPSGEGAFNSKNTRFPTHSPEKTINANNGTTFIDTPQSPTFDDRVRWVTRNNLMAMYAKSPCPPPLPKSPGKNAVHSALTSF